MIWVVNVAEKGSMYVKSRSELEQELIEQLEALKSSCIGYDQGHRWEAKRIAAIAYILFHDGSSNTRSLLGQLRNKPQMLSTKARDPQASFHLVNIKISVTDGVWFDPRLDSDPHDWKWLKFGKWYEEGVMQNGHLRLSRKNVIHVFRSNLGGSHVDPKLDNEAFRWFQKDGPISVKFSSPEVASDTPQEIRDRFKGFSQERDGAVPFGPEAVMRQIGWEILQSIEASGLGQHSS
jgi:hypothetical protein